MSHTLVPHIQCHCKSGAVFSRLSCVCVIADTLDIDSLPGSVEATDASRRDSPQKSLVHGAFLRAASVHKTGKLDTNLFFAGMAPAVSQPIIIGA